MADKTALQESAQALFSSLADFIGASEIEKKFDLNKYPLFADFKSTHKKLLEQSYKRVETPGVSYNDIIKFLEANNDWYISSNIIAVELIKEIEKIDKDFNIKGKGYQNLFYLRGDDAVMGTIQKLFTIANKSPITIKNQAAFGNINKWSPADIYLASKKAKDALAKELKNAKPKSYTFANLNVITSDLIDSGDLLPLSLKKTTKSAQLQQVNFDRKDEIKLLKKISLKGTTDWKPYKRVAFGQKTETRDMRILLNTGGDIKLRHDPSAKRFVAEFLGGGAEARGGSIGSMKVFCELLNFVDTQIAQKVLKDYTDGEKKYYKEIEPYIKQRDKLNKQNPKLFDFKRGEISAVNIINKIMPTLKKFFNDKRYEEKANQFIRIMFEYVTSRTPLSGKFVIAKGK